MNWYKIARRNTYETLANKFANAYFQWFIQQDYAQNYDEEETIISKSFGTKKMPITPTELQSIGVTPYYDEYTIDFEVLSTHVVKESYFANRNVIVEGIANSYAIEKPINEESVPPDNIILIEIYLNKMNKSVWQEFKQELHSTLRHEFEHLNQMVISLAIDSFRLNPVSTPPDQSKNELLRMKSKLFDIQLKFYSISDKIKIDKTIPEIEKQGIKNKIRRHSKVIDYLSNQAELEAFSTTAYYDARQKGIAVEQEINTIVQEMFIDNRYPHEDVDLLAYEAGNLIIHWMLRFVENRYPEYSKQRNQQPV